MVIMDAALQRLSLDSLWFDAALALGLYAFGNILFVRFAVETPALTRLGKLAGFAFLVVAVSAILGREWALGLIAALVVVIFYVHAVWLPGHGINGWTGEPRDRFEALRGGKRK